MSNRTYSPPEYRKTEYRKTKYRIPRIIIQKELYLQVYQVEVVDNLEVVDNRED